MLAYTIGDLTKAWEATEIEFYMQAPQSLQAPIISNLRVCTGLEAWWLHKGVLNLRNLAIFAQTVSRIPCRHFVLCKVASKTKHFIHADILVLVSEFVVVVILSEWWFVLGPKQT